MLKKTNKRAQEEIVGFAVIVIIVSVILLFFFVFSFSSNREAGESYEAASWLQATLQYTSSCESRNEFLSVSDLIVSCYREERCLNSEEYSCDVLNQTLASLVSESWLVGAERPVQGYKLEATAPDKTILSIKVGNETSRYKGTQQPLPVAEAGIRVYFTVYYGES